MAWHIHHVQPCSSWQDVPTATDAPWANDGWITEFASPSRVLSRLGVFPEGRLDLVLASLRALHMATVRLIPRERCRRATGPSSFSSSREKWG